MHESNGDQVGVPGDGFFQMAKSLGVEGAEELPALAFVKIPFPPNSEEWNPHQQGTRVRFAGHRRTYEGRTGTVVKWARSVRAHGIFVAICAGARAANRELVSDDYECLIDSEGPVVQWDQQLEGDDDCWFPGQSSAILDPISLADGVGWGVE